MKKVNFDSLTNLKAPERFIENALNIPNTQPKKKPIAFLKYSRTLAAVACLVIVSSVCLSVYLTQDRITPPINPNYSTETQKGSENQNSNYSENNNDDTKSDSTNSKLPTSSNNNGLVVILPTEAGTIEPNEKPSSTVKPTENGNDRPTTPTKPSETIEPSETPTIRPTAKPTKPSDKPKPTIPQKPTDYEPVIPTDGVGPNDPFEPSCPITPPPTKPSNPGEGSGGSGYYFYTSISLDTTGGSPTIECSVEDPNGNIVVKKDTAYVYSTSNNIAYVFYEIPYYAITKTGNYYCHFYDKNGIHVCSSRTYVQV